MGFENILLTKGPMLSAKNMGKAVIESAENCWKNWKPVKQFQVYEV